MEKIFTKLAKASRSTSTSSTIACSSFTSEETSRSEEAYQELVQRCIKICEEPCTSILGLSDEEICALPMPEKMLHDKKRRDKKNLSKQIDYELKLNDFAAWLTEINAQIDAAKQRGDNLQQFLSEGGRGPNDETTKRLKYERRVQLEWQMGVPIGPGRWSTYFVRYIGFLIRNCENWNVGFTWEENSYEAIVWTWKSLQKYYDLDDASNDKYEFVKGKMGDLFKKYRNRLKNNFNKSTFQHDWQRFYGLPSTVKQEQFCYLLKYWESDRSKEKSRISSENRAKVEIDYYGGSQSILQYRNIMEKASGGPIPLYVMNTALYIGDRTSESEREIVERHNIGLVEGETQYRERNPDYPTDENLPLEEQEAIVDQVFPRSASKGRRPLLGHVRSRNFISSSITQSQQTHSTQSEVITRLQEELRHEQETNAVTRRQMSEIYSQWGNFQQWQQLQQWQLQQFQTSSQQQQIPQQQWIPQQQQPQSHNSPPSQFMPAAPRSHPYMRSTPPSQNRPTLEGDAFLFDWQRRNNNFNLGNDDNNESGS